VNIMNEFVWINIIFFSKFGFRASRLNKIKAKTVIRMENDVFDSGITENKCKNIYQKFVDIS
jgi:hypothetical protein